MNKDTIIARAISREIADLKRDVEVFRTQKAAFVSRKQALKAELDEVDAKIASHTTEIKAAQDLIDALELELIAAQQRAQLPR